MKRLLLLFLPLMLSYSAVAQLTETEVKNMIKKGEHEFESDPDDDVFNFKDAKMHIIRELVLNIRPRIFNSQIPK